MDYYDRVLLILEKSGNGLPWFFSTAFYWRYRYHSDVSNDILLFAKMRIVPPYIKDLLDEIDRRKAE